MCSAPIDGYLYVETFSFALHNLYRIHTWALLSTIYWEQYLLASFYENPNKFFAIAIACILYKLGLFFVICLLVSIIEI